MNGIKDKIEEVAERGERKIDDTIMKLAERDGTLLGVVVGAAIVLLVVVLIVKVF